MTGESVDCFNCGRANPEWAQVCRSCGVPLRHGVARSIPGGRFPTDRDSLVSIGAVVATIVGAILFGLFFSNLNPTDPDAGIAGAPTPSPTEAPTPSPTETPPPEETAEPTQSATQEPSLPGTVAFGTGVDESGNVTGEVDTFTPGTTFAHSITMSDPFGVPEIQEGVVRLNDDGSDGEAVVNFEQNGLAVDPSATVAGWTCCDAAGFIGSWGPGVYVLRVYIEGELVAEGEFRLTEG
jgi:hypothetical protein